MGSNENSMKNFPYKREVKTIEKKQTWYQLLMKIIMVITKTIILLSGFIYFILIVVFLVK